MKEEKRHGVTKFIDRLDPRYTKICLYAGVTVLITLACVFILYNTGGFWASLWAVFSAVLRPIVIGGIFCFLLSPLVNWFEKILDKEKKHPVARLVSILLAYLIVFAAIVGIIAVIILTIYRSVSAINLDTVKELIETWYTELTELWNYVQEKIAAAGLPVGELGNLFTTAVNAVSSFVTGLAFGIIFSVYFLLDGEGISSYWRRAFSLLAGEKAEARFLAMGEDADRIFSGYLRGQLLDSLCVCVEVCIGLMIFGVPDAILVGVLTGLANMIPYVATPLGCLCVVLVCIPEAAWSKMLIGLILIVVLMTIDGNVVNPKLVGNTIKIHPLLVVAALIAGGVIGGVVGIIVGVPIAAFIKLQLDKYLDRLEAEKQAA